MRNLGYRISIVISERIKELVTQPKSKVIEFPIEEAFIRVYKLRFSRSGAKTVEVSIPRDFIRRMARNAGVTMEEFIEQYRALAYFGAGDELLYRFEKYEGDGDGSK